MMRKYIDYCIGRMYLPILRFWESDRKRRGEWVLDYDLLQDFIKLVANSKLNRFNRQLHTELTVITNYDTFDIFCAAVQTLNNCIENKGYLSAEFNRNLSEEPIPTKLIEFLISAEDSLLLSPKACLEFMAIQFQRQQALITTISDPNHRQYYIRRTQLLKQQAFSIIETIAKINWS